MDQADAGATPSDVAAVGDVFVRFLPDVPTGSDLFGSHGRLAGAVADAIRQNPAIKTIGLLGPWGSGKSTAVRAIEELLAKGAEPYRVFTYDAWLHQSDPPRRSFLERLLAFLVAHEELQEADWKEPFDKINRRVEDSTTTTTPHLTVPGRLLLLSLVGVPLGTRFVGADTLAKMRCAAWLSVDRWIFPAGLLLMCAPAIVVAAIFLAWRPERNPFGKAFWLPSNWKAHRSPHHNDSVLGLVVNKQVQSQNSRVVRTPEPTTIEFQKLFREMLAARPAGTRLMIVVDNLDRLPEAEAIDMWTTIRGFFLGASSSKDQLSQASLPTVLLPIDVQGLSRLHGGADEDKNRSLVRSFMDKTFDIVFHVSAPVVSDWQAYMVRALRQALGDAIAEDWGRHVVAIYAKRVSGRVTPRDMNRQVNAIAALWLQWHDEKIPFPIVAYYATFRDTLDADLIGAMKKPEVDLEEFDKDWQRSLAAIHFGVGPGDALQVLLGPDIVETIGEVDHERFAAQARIKGFDVVVSDLLEANRTDLTFVRKAAELLERADGSWAWSTWPWGRIRRIWVQSRLEQWLNGGDDASTLLDLLAKQGTDSDRLQVLTDVARKTASWQRPAASVSGHDPQATFVGLLRVWVKHAEVTPGATPIRLVHDETFLRLAQLLAEQPGALGLITVEATPDELAKLMAIRFGQPDGTDLGAAAKVVLRMGATEEGLQPLSEVTRRTLEKSEWGMTSVEAAVDVALVLHDAHPPAAAWIAEFAAGGRLARMTEQALDHWDKSPAVRMLALLMVHRADLPHAPADGWGELVRSDPEFAPILSGWITHLGGRSLSILAEYGSDEGFQVVVDGILEAWIEEDDLGVVAMDDVVEGSPGYLALALGSRRYRLYQILSRREEFWRALKGSPLSSGAMQIFTDLITVEHVDPKLGARAAASLIEAVTPFRARDWETWIADPARVAVLQGALDRADVVGIADDEALVEALQRLLRQLLFDDRERVDVIAWLTAADLLEEETRRSILRNLRDRLLSEASLEVRLDVLQRGGRLLIEAANFEQEATKAVRQLVLPLLTHGEGLRWILDHADTVGDWIASEAALRSLVRTRLAKRVAGLDDDALAIREQLRRLWNLTGVS